MSVCTAVRLPASHSEPLYDRLHLCSTCTSPPQCLPVKFQFVSPCVRPFVRSCVIQFVCLSVRPSIRTSVCPSVRPSVCASVSVSFCPFDQPPVRQSTSSFVCPSVMSVRPSICLSVRGQWLSQRGMSGIHEPPFRYNNKSKSTASSRTSGGKSARRASCSYAL